MITTKEFDCFKVHTSDDSFSFKHIEIKDCPEFYQSLFDYFFEEDKLIQYIKNQKGIKFQPLNSQYVALYKHLRTYIDAENVKKDVSELDEMLLAILSEEMKLETEDGKQIVRLDKIGKIGEYLFCSLLSSYPEFDFDCIVPKVHYTTDANMSVYGIDTLFYSEKNNLLLFGEAKVCKELGNGIALINKSLSEYEQQLEEEFRLVLSGILCRNISNSFNDKFGDYIDNSYDIHEFIEKAEIKSLGVPIFVAHGNECSEEDIFKKLGNIKTKDFFNIKTVYYLISLPIINKDKLIATITTGIKKKEEDYLNAGKFTRP